jgi:hypothetical protein
MSMHIHIEDLNVQNSVDNSEFINSVFKRIDNPTNIVSNIYQLPKDIITPDLGLSFYDLAIKLNNCQDQLIYWLAQADYLKDVEGNTPVDDETVSKVQNYIRRVLSNFCNNPDNLTNAKNEYIGKKYGLRLTLIANDGWILQNIQTFCQDVKNAGPSFSNGNNTNNNNYISYARSNLQLSASNVYYNPSNIPFQPQFTSTILSVNQSSSSDLPTTLPPTNPMLLNYILIGPDGKPTDEVPPTSESIVSNKILDNHGTRYEVQLSSTSLYGYVSRRSDTNFKFNYYVCKYLGSPPFTLSGTVYNLRLSFFEW